MLDPCFHAMFASVDATGKLERDRTTCTVATPPLPCPYHAQIAAFHIAALLTTACCTCLRCSPTLRSTTCSQQLWQAWDRTSPTSPGVFLCAAVRHDQVVLSILQVSWRQLEVFQRLRMPGRTLDLPGRPIRGSDGHSAANSSRQQTASTAFMC